ELMALDRAQGTEVVRHHGQLEMGLGGRPGMHVALVDDVEMLQVQGLLQFALNGRGDAHALLLLDGLPPSRGMCMCQPGEGTMLLSGGPEYDRGSTHDHWLVSGPHAQGPQGYHESDSRRRRRHRDCRCPSAGVEREPP